MAHPGHSGRAEPSSQGLGKIGPQLCLRQIQEGAEGGRKKRRKEGKEGRWGEEGREGEKEYGEENKSKIPPYLE